MRLLLDQDVYATTARFLIEQGHDVLTVAALGMATADDQDNLVKAGELERLFVTRDRDYGNLVFAQGFRSGVIYLRILARDSARVHAELERVLRSILKSS